MHANLAVFGPSPHRTLRNTEYLGSFRNFYVLAQLVHLTPAISEEMRQPARVYQTLQRARTIPPH